MLSTVAVRKCRQQVWTPFGEFGCEEEWVRDLEGITGLMVGPLSGSLERVHEMLGGPC